MVKEGEDILANLEEHNKIYLLLDNKITKKMVLIAKNRAKDKIVQLKPTSWLTPQTAKGEIIGFVKQTT